MTAAVAANTVGDAEGQARQALENRLKTAFLYVFAKYVEWPAGAFGRSTNTLVIGVLGKDPFGNLLDTTVAGKTIDGRAVRVQRFQRVENLRGCQVLFVAASEKERLVNIQRHLRDRPILTVSDVDGFLQAGGQIQLVTEDGRVRFDVNLDAARRAGPKLDANLLWVARRVIRRGSKAEAD